MNEKILPILVKLAYGYDGEVMVPLGAFVKEPPQPNLIAI